MSSPNPATSTRKKHRSFLSVEFRIPMQASLLSGEASVERLPHDEFRELFDNRMPAGRLDFMWTKPVHGKSEVHEAHFYGSLPLEEYGEWKKLLKEFRQRGHRILLSKPPKEGDQISSR